MGSFNFIALLSWVAATVATGFLMFRARLARNSAHYTWNMLLSSLYLVWALVNFAYISPTILFDLNVESFGVHLELEASHRRAKENATHDDVSSLCVVSLSQPEATSFDFYHICLRGGGGCCCRQSLFARHFSVFTILLGE